MSHPHGESRPVALPAPIEESSSLMKVDLKEASSYTNGGRYSEEGLDCLKKKNPIAGIFLCFTWTAL